MANDFAGNPWLIDTAYATPPSAGHIVSSNIRAGSITWSDMAAGATVQIKDKNGRLIADSTNQATANVTIVLGVPGWVEGLFVPVLSSGKVSITIQKV